MEIFTGAREGANSQLAAARWCDLAGLARRLTSLGRGLHVQVVVSISGTCLLALGCATLSHVIPLCRLPASQDLVACLSVRAVTAPLIVAIRGCLQPQRFLCVSSLR